LPKWAYGYVQSKEQYYSAAEMADVVKKYRDLDVPIDCIVQDWNSWPEGQWGQKSLDPTRYGDVKEKMQEIHDMHVHTMVSVWPNMNTGTPNHTELTEAGYMLNDLATYDAFNEKAREIYWKQAEEGLYANGFDSWWCDSTEPFSGPDWGGEIKREPWVRFQMVGTEHKKYLPAEKANAYALMHAKGMSENQRKSYPDKRMLNLTRSGYASGQKYGAMLWSGDITGSWTTMKKQIAEGLNMAMSGYPYWTLDIGGFFTVGKEWTKRGCSCNTDPTPKWFWKGIYDDGVKDKGYCELYTRWIQMGCFLPMFRSHGTDTPREIWNFGEKGTMFYDAIEKYIRLRYRLMPYIYAMAGAVRRNRFTIMRSLLFDFAADEKAKDIDTEFMFGRNLLICPVLEPMYYENNSRPIEREKEKQVYLPAGTDWYDFRNDRYYEGGQEVRVEAPLDSMPVFVKAGSILPMEESLSYAQEHSDRPMEIHVYRGADAEFTLYEDNGEDYSYENGAFATTRLIWKEAEGKLTIEKREGSFPGMQPEREYTVILHG
ncbi:MAG: glycoside hydrolase family 31 protein, partial [Eubacteriales bacterium]|nr:glycoside hydrolase family 31 protein [Eubacteriales bacterium]